ncbi:MAG: hypothetical protein ACRCVI_02450 [Mycoplasmoidaceae bacterium]
MSEQEINNSSVPVKEVVDTKSQTIDPKIVKHYKFCKMYLIFQIIGALIALAGGIVGIIIDINNVQEGQNNLIPVTNLVNLGATGIMFVINIVWVIKTIMLKTDNSELNRLLLMLGIAGLFVGFIVNIILIARLKREYPDIGKVKTS